MATVKGMVKRLVPNEDLVSSPQTKSRVSCRMRVKKKEKESAQGRISAYFHTSIHLANHGPQVGALVRQSHFQKDFPTRPLQIQRREGGGCFTSCSAIWHACQYNSFLYVYLKYTQYGRLETSFWSIWIIFCHRCRHQQRFNQFVSFTNVNVKFVWFFCREWWFIKDHCSVCNV